MLRIAVCDDLPQDMKSLLSLIDEYLSINNLEAEIKAFSHPDALLNAIEAESFHLYILDIVMPMINGLELGKALRRMDLEAQIVYITSEPQFALQAYAVFPVSYLTKPIDKERLFETLTLAISKAKLDMEQTFQVKTADSLRVVKLADILCCEYRSHAVTFTLLNGEAFVSRTFRESYADYMASILIDKHFIQCHASFVVNMRRIEQFRKDSFILRGGKIVPIAAKQYATVRDTYMDYLMAKGDLS